ncbi:MAG: CoB--CoM heterodisulfide reductase iron-sulfur subunit A family protein [Nitrospinae bacterium]|nr:CoB--CoM heterodisulfide reductase iron-sulfur subunit A family protein [Nitrospinota bacterium]
MRILVVGGGISGITAAVEVAEVGHEVTLIEKNPYLGGMVARMNRYFPKLCPPSCGLEINFKRIQRNKRIRVYTLAEVERISGRAGDLEQIRKPSQNPPLAEKIEDKGGFPDRPLDVTIRLNPRHVNEKCTACGQCAEACSLEIPNELNYGMDKIKAAYLPHEMAFPMRYVLDPRILGTDDAHRCAQACAYQAIDLSMQPKRLEIQVDSIVWATGWQPYDATRLDNLGFGRYPNVITNVMMERLAAPNGPTGGRIARPSDGKAALSVAFVQCAGSRDTNHLPYCSAVCCLASLKQTTYLREQNPDSRVRIFYIDVRAPGRLEEFYAKVKNDEKVKLTKGKVARITEDPATRDPVVEAEDIVSGERVRVRVDLAVLATGMAPTPLKSQMPMEVRCDENGFIASDLSETGIYPVGCVRRPSDVASSVREATAAALKAIQSGARK